MILKTKSEPKELNKNFSSYRPRRLIFFQFLPIKFRCMIERENLFIAKTYYFNMKLVFFPIFLLKLAMVVPFAYIGIVT